MFASKYGLRVAEETLNEADLKAQNQTGQKRCSQAVPGFGHSISWNSDLGDHRESTSNFRRSVRTNDGITLPSPIRFRFRTTQNAPPCKHWRTRFFDTAYRTRTRGQRRQARPRGLTIPSEAQIYFSGAFNVQLNRFGTAETLARSATKSFGSTHCWLALAESSSSA